MMIDKQKAQARQPQLNVAQRALETLSDSISADISSDAGNTYTETQEYIYVVGHVNAHFPNLSVEKEFYYACVLTGVDVSSIQGVDDDVALAKLNQDHDLNTLLFKGLSQPENEYVAREMNWLLSNVDNNEVYTLITDSDDSLRQFIASLGLDTQPVILVGQMMQDGRVLVSNLIPCDSTAVNKQHLESQNNNMKELVEEIRSLNSNNGIRNEDRALNYTLYNNKKVFSESYNLCYNPNPSGPNPNGYQLVNVEVVTNWSGDRLVSKLIFNYQGINTGAKQSWYSTVDVTGEYPFTLTQWQRFLPQY
ncbi:MULTISPECIES: hypothetical protein [unclassified Vibrio]|uniref:cyanobactin maturation protease PatG family protein n=1 Tax=unclassified Vibrio TaxID=2614977 RepID=UPI001360D755|nr:MULTISPECIES: hypothetical protein [unclassified Vibrio]NAW59342.1 hypothetical protein [Vibrio sp. V36_P2S2PM302]NAX26783.1 hypothetical protein [Vibrio sp. V38_P2S17PM301]NAX31555.1 hypothetical protein [Vibrio sp. V37_P2S8PM304]